jgi:hypothetical protein
MTELVSYKGKRFVVRCNCNGARYLNDCEKYGDGRVSHMSGTFAGERKCYICNLFKWFILPKKEKIS